jgi:hypothetical protein
MAVRPKLFKQGAAGRHGYELLCIDPFAGRAVDDDQFRKYSKFWDRAREIHRVSAREAH